MMADDWKAVLGYEGLYVVNSCGVVKSLGRSLTRKDGRPYNREERVLTQHPDAKGYMKVHLCKDGKSKNAFVHRLVAQAFIPNPDNLPQVNHINEVKSDNRVENLEWVTCRENVNHGTGVFRNAIARSVPVVRISQDGGTKWFRSASHAAEVMHIVSQGIQNCCAHRQKTYKGYRWEYAEVDA
jgi:hypothetical protein